MESLKVLGVVEFYREKLEREGIKKKRMDSSKSFANLSREESLAHAHFLLDGIAAYAKNLEQQGKTGRHLASVQMILSFAGWYTLEELMNHNRPSAR